MQRRIGKEYVDLYNFKNNLLKYSLSCCLDKNNVEGKSLSNKGGKIKFFNIAVKKMEKDKEMEDE